MPVTSARNRKLWRDVFLSDKAHDAGNPDTCTCFFKTHAQDFALLCLDELDKIYAISEAQERLIEALDEKIKSFAYRKKIETLAREVEHGYRAGWNYPNLKKRVRSAKERHRKAISEVKASRAAMDALRAEVNHE
ncbi:hypothetical protein LJC59_00845 [Desulfovibrio sp. OttesenSCG-928-A18]|nr:hypothetical protein [Desulfovibrio sp. OttesenSCG-928-A18]